jgi:hypothetical protein
MIFKQPPATKKQIDYLEVLFNDCGFTLATRKIWLLEGYKVEYTEGLNMYEASAVITYLKELKAQKEIDNRGKLEL